MTRNFTKGKAYFFNTLRYCTVFYNSLPSSLLAGLRFLQVAAMEVIGWATTQPLGLTFVLLSLGSLSSISLDSPMSAPMSVDSTVILMKSCVSAGNSSALSIHFSATITQSDVSTRTRRFGIQLPKLQRKPTSSDTTTYHTCTHCFTILGVRESLYYDHSFSTMVMIQLRGT